MDAVILLNKPAGMTSFDAVRKCRRIFGEKKAGHTGTLDPQASGLMIILLGKYTKYLPFCVKDHKRYHAEFLLGYSTETEDIWGATVKEQEPVSHTEDEIDAAVKKLTGTISQIPPMYSAIKVNGKKLYEYARKGIEVERAPRTVTVSSLAVKHLEGNRYSMDAVVSSGTYVRTLITDFAAELGELGVMSALVREGIEHLSLADAATFEELENGIALPDPACVLNPEYHFVEAEDPAAVRNGRRLKLDTPYDYLFFTEDGLVLAAYSRQEDGLFHCERGLL